MNTYSKHNSTHFLISFFLPFDISGRKKTSIHSLKVNKTKVVKSFYFLYPFNFKSSEILRVYNDLANAFLSTYKLILL